MQRLKDFGRFGLWFLGLAYLISVFTGHAETLPQIAQIVGALAGVAALVQLLLIAVRHSRRGDKGEPKVRLRRRPEPTVMRVKARDHFGLRGMDREMDRGLDGSSDR